MSDWIDALNWPDNGLLPAIAQDANTGVVLTQAWQNREALRRTQETGFVHYWSRSRNQLWKKGETSGHTQRVVEIRTDCDRDTILMLVEPAGPACHTGAPSCFYTVVSDGELHDQPDNPWPSPSILDRLAAVIDARRQADPKSSYTATLLADPDKAAGKVSEESQELIEAVRQESAERVAAEAADLCFHLLVLSATRGVDWSQIAAVLEQRFGTSGHEEKARRALGKRNQD
ncbi:MAG: bifunctional phosphoribosyl-AMP cyclohydrolase/phosphoribosyl-ATP diphosphatase HisIE [Candidatus Dadabacteria bacterium]|nr:MAG: bifunctional phosphoribosyl-AMP cyclohydrolase/phosphoribosyl-ATP diphosphatase HisIE [Candidatus Dadabacteria bacterium]